MPLRLLLSYAISERAPRGAAVLVLAILPLVAGCPTEVPYQTDQEPAEAPASDPVEPANESSDPSAETDAASGEQEASSAPPAEGADPTAGDDRYATPTGQGPARMPWETDQPDAEANPDAERLFADATPSAKPDAEPEEPAEPPSGEGDGFANFLDDAYAGMLEKEEPEESAKPEPPNQSEIAAPDVAEVGSRYGASELFAEDQPAIDLPPPDTADPSQPASTVEPSDSDLLSELWGDEPETAEPETSPAADVEPAEPTPAEPVVQRDELPFDSDEQTPPTEPTPRTREEPPLFAEEPEPEAAEPAETLPEPPATEPEPFAASPNPPPRFEPAVDPPEPREAPMASSAIDPLPAVPVLPFNTRHLAWLLGAKYGLAELADLDGATDDEVAEWSSEVERLAEELRIGVPSSARTAADPAERVGRMMRSAARTGEALATEHGIDHAALLEISLKTNALLVVAEKRPDLAAPVARAVRDAADRALLPRFLWDQSVRVLESEPTPEEAHDAVTRLHERVESFLR